MEFFKDYWPFFVAGIIIVGVIIFWIIEFIKFKKRKENNQENAKEVNYEDKTEKKDEEMKKALEEDNKLIISKQPKKQNIITKTNDMKLATKKSEKK